MKNEIIEIKVTMKIGYEKGGGKTIIDRAKKNINWYR